MLKHRPNPRRVLVTLIACLLLWPALPSAAVPDDTEVTFVGSGWGHGVGMSQYGAYGMALNGYGYGQILNHYYKGTSVVGQSTLSLPGFINGEEPLWIGLLQDRASVTFKVTGGDAVICQGWNGDCSRTAHAGESWRFSVNANGKCVFKKTQPAEPAGAGGSCDASVRPESGTVVGVGPEGYTYRSGIFRLRQVPGSDPVRFHLSLQLGIDPYLRGIAEVPTWWPSEVLKAQVIAARSYLVSNTVAKGPQGGFSAGVKQSCWCHLYDDTRSQVYKGDVLWENANWKSAVTSTAGKVVAYNGNLVRAFYSSSSGGKTENVEDVWGGSGSPWLVSVDDHWAHIPEVNNSMSSWARVRTAGDIASKVGLDELKAIKVEHRPSGGVATITFIGVANGANKTVTRTGTWARTAFSLPSHYFDVTGISSGETNAYQTSLNSATPIGWIDAITDTGEGSFRARGWALDFDTELPIIIHIYVDGKFAKGLWADDPRADVANVYHNGKDHGYNTTVAAGNGSHTVCVYAINAPTKTGNPKIGCKTVTVSGGADGSTGSSSSSTGSKPFGWIDNVSISGGALHARGWAIDKDASDKAVPIHIYVDGKFFTGGPAGQTRNDVEKAFGLGANHGYDFDVSISSGTHKVCIYAINLPEKTGNPLLGCRTVSG